MTQEQVVAFLEHPFINFAGVAKAFYDDGRQRPAQALWRRVYGVKAISESTRSRITALCRQLDAEARE